MNIDDFFQLPWEEQEAAAKVFAQRRMIRSESESIKRGRASLNEEEQALQNRCQHPATKKTHKRNEHYDSHTNFSTDFYCPDCDKRWTEEGSL